MKGRYAPSPTGELHLGNVATALLAWLQIKQLGGQFLLRIEDNDQQRSKPEFIDQIFFDLEWLGLTWDEKPVLQSERTALYREALNTLQSKGLTYPCFCSRKDIQTLASAPHSILSDGPDYPGFCRDLSAEEQEAMRRDKDPSIRFKLPHQSYSYTDIIRGEQSFAPGWGGDFVIKRADDMWAYQLACTVDDLEMGITHVIRGGDLVDSTPRQIAIIRALGNTPPSYGHTPLWMGSDDHRLSKRNGALSIRDYREKGKTQEEIFGWIARRCGLTETSEHISLHELVELFDISKLNRETVHLISSKND